LGYRNRPQRYRPLTVDGEEKSKGAPPEKTPQECSPLTDEGLLTTTFFGVNGRKKSLYLHVFLCRLSSFLEMFISLVFQG